MSNENTGEAKTKDEKVVLSARGVDKFYPGTAALRGVDFDVSYGEVNVLIGENGAGKSTLMKILAGIEKPSQGELILNGDPIVLLSPRQAMGRGIGIVHQELSLFPNLSVSDNLFVGRECRGRFGDIKHEEQINIAQNIMYKMGQDINVNSLVQELSIGKQQIVEIARVLISNVDVLILDEPTSSLSDSEVETLFELIDQLKQQGVSIVYISHRLEELIEIGDNFTVLRDGELVGRGRRGQVDIPWLVEHMVGTQLEGPYRHVPPDYQVADNARNVLCVEKLKLADTTTGGLLLNEITFHITEGEIVGFYGLMGAGRTELFETLIGLRCPSGGRIAVAGRDLTWQDDIATRIEAGLTLVPEDRQRLGLIQSQSVANNIALSNLRAYKRFRGLDFGAIGNDVARIVRELLIKVTKNDILVSALSGGNQQKVVLGKNLLTAPKVLLLDEPTRGIDIKARRELFQIIDRLAKKGLTILYSSSDINEIKGGADRVIVMAQGAITADITRADVTEERLVEASQVKRPEKENSL